MFASMLVLQPVQATDAPALPDDDVIVSVGAEYDICVFKLAGERMANDTFAERLAAIKDKSRSVIVIANESTPNRCIGGAIYLIQLAEFNKIGFMSKSAADNVGETNESKAAEYEAAGLFR